MILENKLNITDQIELPRAEEKISKQKAKQLFDTGDIHKVEVGRFGNCQASCRLLVDFMRRFLAHHFAPFDCLISRPVFRDSSAPPAPAANYV